MYNGLCGACHGLNAVSGGVLPDLRYMTAKTHAEFIGIVGGGARIHKGMPSFGNMIPPETIELIRQYSIKRAHDLKKELAAMAGAGSAAAK